jgi:nucleoid-associated protein YgaU
MPIYVGSRYEHGIVGFVADAAGVQHLTVYRAEPTPQSPPPNFYVVRVGDRLDTISFRVYGRPDLWWVLADANPDVLLPDPLDPGLTLLVPDVRLLR